MLLNLFVGDICSEDQSKTEFLRGSGAGFLWDQDGHIVTNYHVICGASTVKFVCFFHFVLLLLLHTHTKEGPNWDPAH